MPKSKDTSCKSCDFAKYDGNTQIGCHLDMIDKFKKAGTEIIEAYDEDKEFYVVKERLCHFSRPEAWGKGRSLEEKIKAVKFETKVPFNAIIFAEHNYDALKRTLGSLYRQTYLPVHITVIRSMNSQIRPGHITDLLGYRKIKWRLENLRQNEMSNWRAFHLVQKFCIYPYHAIFQSGYKAPKNFFENINNAIIDDLKQFGIIKDQPSSQKIIGSGTVIPTSVYSHVYFNGNSDINFVDNLKEIECQTKQNLTHTIEDLCQQS